MAGSCGSVAIQIAPGPSRQNAFTPNSSTAPLATSGGSSGIEDHGRPAIRPRRPGGRPARTGRVAAAPSARRWPGPSRAASRTRCRAVDGAAAGRTSARRSRGRRGAERPRTRRGRPARTRGPRPPAAPATRGSHCPVLPAAAWTCATPIHTVGLRSSSVVTRSARTIHNAAATTATSSTRLATRPARARRRPTSSHAVACPTVTQARTNANSTTQRQQRPVRSADRVPGRRREQQQLQEPRDVQRGEQQARPVPGSGAGSGTRRGRPTGSARTPRRRRSGRSGRSRRTRAAPRAAAPAPRRCGPAAGFPAGSPATGRWSRPWPRAVRRPR